MLTLEEVMRGLNRTMLIGHLGRDPEIRSSRDGQHLWATFTLATGRSHKEGGEWVEATDWHRVKVFGTQAELCQRYLGKGHLVAVEGSVVYDVWTDKEGVRRKSTTINADRVTFLSKPRERREPAAEEPAQQVAQAK